MPLVITNGEYYILHTDTGSIKKTQNLNEAEIFQSVNKASEVIRKASHKANNYYVYDTVTQRVCWKKYKRKSFTPNTRKMVYDKSRGRCELCGREILLSEMTVDHIVPLVMGGSNSAENLQCTCKVCNSFKGHILPDDFMERITEIFMYQMEKKYGDRLAWKIIKRWLLICK